MKHITQISVLVVMAIMVFSCKKQEAKNSTPEKQVFAVTTMKAVSGEINSYLALAGDIIAGSTVDAYSDAAGKITRVHVSVGSRVGRGQAIALVDPSKPGMRYVLHTVRSPIAGTITSLPAEVGMTVSQTTPLARIAGGGALEIQLFVPERYIARVAQGLSCEITLDAYPDEVFRGSVREVSPTIDPVSRTEMIKINVDNPGSRLKAGMFAKVNIITVSKSDAIKIPTAAIVQRQGKNVVFVAGVDPADPQAYIARQVEVVPGIESDGVSEIASGITAGDEIVDKGMTLLTDGAGINVISRSEGVQ
ncbi:MAG: efflux RND transporter periplasmic adaptor subunit [Spirochaetaceae bacterium]|jgi:multidrug efflux pump subunit AcrA (membrane-fusion protein)|nr:efflux RND transporter periplasmic adaptor subunit [Spirochaetaceae bacterium]